MVCFVLLFRKLCKSCFKRLLLLVWTTLEEQLSCPPLGHSNSWERSHLTTQKTSQLLHKLSNPYKTEIRIIQPKCKRSKTKFPKKKKKKKKPLQKLNHPNTQIGSNGKNQEKLKRRIQPIGKKKLPSPDVVYHYVVEYTVTRLHPCTVTRVHPFRRIRNLWCRLFLDRRRRYLRLVALTMVNHHCEDAG